MFQVKRLESALQELAAIWTQADSTVRQKITTATHQIDLLLQSDPMNVGESRPQGRRILHQAPLGITFEVRPSQSLVRVLHVWGFRTRRP